MIGSGPLDNEYINSRPGAIMQFASHMFSQTAEGKAEVLNLFQYVFLAIIPIFLLNKAISMYIPGADETKGSLELAIEVGLQLVAMFGGMVLTHRAITYIPTYSGYKYDPLTLTNCVLAFLILIFSIQSKLSAKMNILYFRIQEKISGETSEAYTPPPVSSKQPMVPKPDLSMASSFVEKAAPAFSVKPTSSGIQF
jgi:uncharacterized membrane protein